MSKLEVRAILGTPDHKDDARPWADEVHWVYSTLGMSVVFDRSGDCVAIEFNRISDPVLEGTRLLRVDASIAWSRLRDLDPDAAVDDDSLKSMRLGVAIWAPDIAEEPDEPATSVLIFRSDYYDSE